MTPPTNSLFDHVFGKRHIEAKTMVVDPTIAVSDLHRHIQSVFASTSSHTLPPTSLLLSTFSAAFLSKPAAPVMTATATSATAMVDSDSDDDDDDVKMQSVTAESSSTDELLALLRPIDVKYHIAKPDQIAKVAALLKSAGFGTPATNSSLSSQSTVADSTLTSARKRKSKK